MLVRTFEANSFRAPCSWFLNDDAIIAYARKASNTIGSCAPVGSPVHLGEPQSLSPLTSASAA